MRFAANVTKAEHLVELGIVVTQSFFHEIHRKIETLKSFYA